MNFKETIANWCSLCFVVKLQMRMRKVYKKHRNVYKLTGKWRKCLLIHIQMPRSDHHLCPPLRLLLPSSSPSQSVCRLSNHNTLSRFSLFLSFLLHHHHHFFPFKKYFAPTQSLLVTSIYYTFSTISLTNSSTESPDYGDTPLCVINTLSFLSFQRSAPVCLLFLIGHRPNFFVWLRVFSLFLRFPVIRSFVTWQFSPTSTCPKLRKYKHRCNFSLPSASLSLSRWNLFDQFIILTKTTRSTSFSKCTVHLISGLCCSFSDNPRNPSKCFPLIRMFLNRSFLSCSGWLFTSGCRPLTNCPPMMSSTLWVSHDSELSQLQNSSRQGQQVHPHLHLGLRSCLGSPRLHRPLSVLCCQGTRKLDLYRSRRRIQLDWRCHVARWQHHDFLHGRQYARRYFHPATCRQVRPTANLRGDCLIDGCWWNDLGIFQFDPDVLHHEADPWNLLHSVRTSWLGARIREHSASSPLLHLRLFRSDVGRRCLLPGSSRLRSSRLEMAHVLHIGS